MFFEEHEKKIYRSPPPFERDHDPLRVDRLLTIASGNRLDEWVTLRNTKNGETGDVSKEGRVLAAVEGAKAELELARVARTAFGLPEFPECTDGDALEALYHFLGWMEGKGERAGTTLLPPTSAPGS